MTFRAVPRVALAVITRRLQDSALILDFLENAHHYGHPIERVIVAHSHGVDPDAVAAIRGQAQLDLLRAGGDEDLKRRLRAGGMTPSAVDDLLTAPAWDSHRQASYSAYRNAILLHALMEGLDAVLFFDTDVHPKVLTGVTNGLAQFRQVDFAGAHLHALATRGVVATTSEYSGYYIIPPMAFDGLESLLIGLRKQAALEYVETSHGHHCLNLGSTDQRRPRPTNKPLGGNLGLGLRHPEDLSLFYSTTYAFQGACIMGRGEDTLLGQAIARSSRGIVDVDLPVFHDTYPGFPVVPDIFEDVIRTRFYQACLGWIGRNPFLTWFLEQTGELATTFDESVERQRAGLQVGGRQAAGAFDDPRFADLALAFEASLRALPAAILRYRRLMHGWRAFLAAFYPEGGSRPNLLSPLAAQSPPAVFGQLGSIDLEGGPVANSTTVG